MYPFTRFDFQAVLARYPIIEDSVWVQEEPKNQGTWYAMQSRMATAVRREGRCLFALCGQGALGLCGGGLLRIAPREQEEFIDEALGPMPWGF